MALNRVAILVKKASLEFEKISNPFFSKYDLSSSQFRILKYLYLQPTGTARVVDLERQYSMTHPTAVNLVETLEKKGFIQRIANPKDARGKLVALTDKASGMQDELEALGEKIEEKLTRRLSGDEKDQLILLLQKLIGIDESSYGYKEEQGK